MCIITLYSYNQTVTPPRTSLLTAAGTRYIWFTRHIALPNHIYQPKSGDKYNTAPHSASPCYRRAQNQRTKSQAVYSRTTAGRTTSHSAGPTNGTENRATFASSGSQPRRRMSSRMGSMMAALITRASSEEMCTSLELHNSSENPAMAAGSERAEKRVGGEGGV